ncbi:cardiolipin synthetase 2 [Desulfuromusa kysingii]|uniref:Cardiolipin synthase n=1 Tax=Desulfuromusa kysingii TaxID=37625 RepID=A0A1H4DHE4_9BACT|nr:cardiolipin synthase [Desulfuromusa kysingii]SEA72017.1 cardiolipin synthetase 2 [Desulfuromusa kysingii]
MLTFLLAILWIFSLLTAGHALLTKRDPRAAVGWIITCLAIPGIGALLYWLLGVNRIRTRSRELQEHGRGMHWLHVDQPPRSNDIANFPDNSTSQPLIKLSDTVTRRPLTYGNKIKVLYNGEQAYPAMLEAINGAQESIYLSSYILKFDQIGQRFAQALIAAAERGVDVRVLVDAFGEFYSFKKIRHQFRGTKVHAATFMPLTLVGSFYFNLRNHRKLLIVDNKNSFTGGMNIRDRHMVENKGNSNRVIDIHFCFAGPICAQLRDAFMEDWHFATKETRAPHNWPTPPIAGEACCRGISAGPNERHETLNWILLGALACAKSHIRIMTPYFIPNRAQLAAINTASLRGVRVDILLPEKNNLPYVAWASNALLFELLEYETHIYFQPPPFIHSKLLLIDDQYALIGSANLDPRSLRLNFEFNVEVFDTETVAELTQHFDQSREKSREISLEEMDSRSLPLRLRDSLCRLFSPYL